MERVKIPNEIHNQIVVLLEKTSKEKPRQEDILALRKLFKDNPDLWRSAGDLAQQAQLRIIKDTPMSPGARETVEAGLTAIRRELCYNESPMLEQLIIEQVLLSWLRLAIFEQNYTGLEKQGMTLPKAAFWDKRLSAAQGRFLRACETLARVRKLARHNPALQVNIATQDGKQVNIAGDFVKKG